ncbi:unnamed protein product, partial [Rotaria sp. Silwood1]
MHRVNGAYFARRAETKLEDLESIPSETSPE